MNHAELDNQVRAVLPAILKRIGFPVLAYTFEHLPPFEMKHRRRYRKDLSVIEEILEDYAARGRSHDKTLALVRDCLTELHVIR